MNHIRYGTFCEIQLNFHFLVELSVYSPNFRFFVNNIWLLSSYLDSWKRIYASIDHLSIFRCLSEYSLWFKNEQQHILILFISDFEATTTFLLDDKRTHHKSALYNLEIFAFVRHMPQKIDKLSINNWCYIWWEHHSYYLTSQSKW